MLRKNYSLKLLLFPQKNIFTARIQVCVFFCSTKLRFPYYAGSFLCSQPPPVLSKGKSVGEL